MNIKYSAISNRKNIFLFIVSSIFFILTVFLCFVIFPGVSHIEILVETDHDENIKIFYSNGIRKEKFQEVYSVTSETLSKGDIQNLTFKIGGNSVNNLRIDIGDKPGSVKIYSISIYSIFSKTVNLNPNDIYQIFKSNYDTTVFNLERDYVEIISSQNDSYITCNNPIIKANLLLAYGLPLAVSILLFLVLQRTDFLLFPAIADITEKRPTTGNNIDALDGLRGLATVMVVADHSWGRFTGLGAGGVWLFMSLSGFLLAKQFILHPERVLSLKFFGTFFLRRIERIVPVYYLYIIVIYLLNYHFNEAVRHFLFLQGNGHLWVVPQEMFFYCLIPPLMIVNFLVLRNKPWLIIFNLTVLMVLANNFLTADIVSLYGMDHKQLRPFVGVFLAGIVASYLYYAVYKQYEDRLLPESMLTKLFQIVAVVLLIFFLCCSTGKIWGGYRIYAQIYFQWFGVAAGILLFSIISAKKSMINRVLSCFPLRAIGLVSFSLYIFHPLILNINLKAMEYYTGCSVSGFPLFLSTLIGGYIVACFTYTYIERPFLYGSCSLSRLKNK